MRTSRDSLSEALREWQVTPPSDPNFRHNVWRRIGGPAGSNWPAYLRAHPTAWVLAAALAVTVAGYTGSTLARAHVRADRETMVVAYLVDLDPRVQAVLKP